VLKNIIEVGENMNLERIKGLLNVLKKTVIEELSKSVSPDKDMDKVKKVIMQGVNEINRELDRIHQRVGK
jgi:predicted DNA-binding transcriptional regulator